MADARNQPASYEWDDEGEALHVEKHGVPFGVAAGVFDDPDRIEKEDLRKGYGERRWNTVGVVDGICVNVTYAMRDDTARIISARAASRKERKAYGYDP